MAGSYTQLLIHIVFSTKRRQRLLLPEWRQELFKYMNGIISGKGQKPIAVNGWVDHVHVLVSMKPTITVSDLVRDIKNNSSKWVNDQRLVPGRFAWQSGYAAFSCNSAKAKSLYQYIHNQEPYHAQKEFEQEYLELMESYGVDYEEKYLFD